ncbi:hypothetical protein G9A89_023347 [Geosiphon pyriformis]|nr:hypothetical protein G9A89_023347 [Geosiphon pyriformis]
MTSLLNIALDTENDIENKELKLCGICKIQFSRYICPRCNLLYCSLGCYKHDNHLNCTEMFYKNNIIEEIKNKEVDDFQKRRMFEILQKFEQRGDELTAETAIMEGIENENNDQDIAERFEHLDIENASFETIWSQLTSLEREKMEREFEQISLTGKLGDLGTVLVEEVQLWKPWWEENQNYESDIRSSKVQMVEQEDFEEIKGGNGLNFPNCQLKILQNIQNLEELTRIPPNPDILFNLQVLIQYRYAFAHTCRYLNGEIYENPEETATILWDLSFILNSNTSFVYENVSEAIAANLQNALEKSPYKQPPEFFLIVLKDLLCILSSFNNVLIALSELYRVFQDANNSKKGKIFQSFQDKIPSTGSKKQLRPSSTKQHDDIKKKKEFLTKKKIYFYLVYCNSLSKKDEGRALLDALRYAVEIERDARKRTAHEYHSTKEEIEKYLTKTRRVSK